MNKSEMGSGSATSVPGPRPESYYQQVLDSIASGVLALDEGGCVIMVNRAACGHLELPPESLRTGKHLRDLPIPGPFLEVLEEVMRDHKPVSRREILIPRADGSKKEIGLSGSLLRNQVDSDKGLQPLVSDEFNGAVFLFVDMTERRTLERAAELNRQLAQIGALTAGVVHELRNPLSVISGMGEILQRKIDPDDSRRRPIDVIVSEAKQMAHSIAQFLGFAKPFELEPRYCQPEQIAARAIELCEGHARKKNVTITTEASGELPQIHADAVRLAQAVANIVSNAIEVVPAQEGHVTVRVYRDGSDVVFQITDNGPGIHLKTGEDLFDPFFTKREGGTGLGLAICHRIVTAHAGSVVYSNAEIGATFVLRVPIQKGAP